MKIKVSEATNIQLDWMVAKCEGYSVGISTVEEQWIKFIRNVKPEEMEKHGNEYTLMKSTFVPKMCKVHSDGYKSICDAALWKFSTNPAQAYPIIERERIDVFSVRNGGGWCAQSDVRVYNGYGPTPLIAAMRCYVSSTLGDEVETPEELCK